MHVALSYNVDLFSIECHKTKIEVILLLLGQSQQTHSQHNERIRTWSNHSAKHKKMRARMIGFGFIFNWLRKDVARYSPESNNVIFRIKVLRIFMNLITKQEYSRCSNRFSANSISNVWRPERRIWRLRPGIKLL